MRKLARKLKTLIFSMFILMIFSFPLWAFAEAGTTQGDSEELIAPTANTLATEIRADTDTETDPTIITEADIPLSVVPYETGWSIVSLCASIFTIIIGVALVTMSMMRKGNGKGRPSNNFGLAVFSMVAAIVSTVLFTSTEEIQASMIVADSFTVVHVALLAVSVLCAFLFLKKDPKTSLSGNSHTTTQEKL
jgi:hypothetical protein